MSGLELAAVLVAGAWLAILSLVAVLCVRQLGILTAGLGRAAVADSSQAADGLSIGMRVPLEVRSLVPGLDGLKYLLFLETGCGSCHELVADLADSGTDAPIVAIIQGEERRAGTLAAVLPAGTPVVADLEAAEVAERMEVEMTPTVLEVERGFVTGKGTLRGLFDLESLIKARERDGERVANEFAELSGLNVEVYDGSR